MPAGIDAEDHGDARVEAGRSGDVAPIHGGLCCTVGVTRGVGARQRVKLHGFRCRNRIAGRGGEWGWVPTTLGWLMAGPRGRRLSFVEKV